MKEPWQDGDEEPESVAPELPPMLDLVKMKATTPLRPLFPMRIDDCECVVRDDGAVFFYSASMGGWIEHSQIPGTPAARSKDDDATQD